MVNFVIIPYPPFIRKVSICFIKVVKLYQTWKPFLKIFIVGSWNWLQSSWRIFFERYFHFLPFEIHINTTDVYNMSISHFIKIYVWVCTLYVYLRISGTSDRLFLQQGESNCFPSPHSLNFYLSFLFLHSL